MLELTATRTRQLIVARLAIVFGKAPLRHQPSAPFEPVERKLDPEKAKNAKIDRLELDEKKFRWLLNENAMATEKLSEGIRKFAADIVKLEKAVAGKL